MSYAIINGLYLKNGWYLRRIRCSHEKYSLKKHKKFSIFWTKIPMIFYLNDHYFCFRNTVTTTEIIIKITKNVKFPSKHTSRSFICIGARMSF